MQMLAVRARGLMPSTMRGLARSKDVAGVGKCKFFEKFNYCEEYLSVEGEFRR